MWVKKSPDDLEKQKKADVPFKIIKALAVLLNDGGGYSPSYQMYGCIGCRKSTEEPSKVDGKLRCPDCNGEVYRIEELNWKE